MTFGEYLREILTEREINPTHLARCALPAKMDTKKLQKTK